jgi:hypothetical protein
MNASLDAARAAFAKKSSDELADTLRILAADARLDSMPSKFRLAMEAAADRLEEAEKPA